MPDVVATRRIGEWNPGHGAAGRLQSVQMLRFFAAALVAYAHCVDADLAGGRHPLVAGSALENFGAVGVDIFFVISGYIITRTIRTAPTVGAFWRDRLIRVVPIYWVCSLPAAWLVISAEGFRPGVLASTVLFWPVWGKFTAPYLAVGWSLAFEMLFYLVMGLTRMRFGTTLVALAYFLAFAAQLVWPQPVLQFLGNPIILEFLFGATVVHFASPRLAVPALALGLIWLVAAQMAGTGLISEAEYTVDAGLAMPRLVLWGVPSALICLGAVSLEGACQGRIATALARLGDASYALYLSHHYVLLVLGRLLRGVAPALDLTLPLLVATFVVGWLVHTRIEKPLLRWLRRRPVRPVAAAAPLLPPLALTRSPAA